MRKVKEIQKGIAILLSIVLVAAVLPTGFGMETVQAGSGTLYVDNVSVTGSNTDVLGNGTVSYDETTNTLTLTNANLTTPQNDANYVYGIYYKGSGQTLNLVLNGTNTISTGNVENAKECYGIYLEASDTLHVSGTGTLNITVGDAGDDSIGIQTGSLIMEAGTITAAAGEATTYDSAGIRCENGMEMKGGNLTGRGDSAGDTSYGICTKASGNKISGGKITGIGGNCTASKPVTSAGIYAGTTTFIKGGSVTATGGKAVATGGESYLGDSYGFTCGAALHIEGGTVTCTGGEGSSGSTGIHVRESGFYIEDGVLTATGGTAEKSYGAICRTNLYMTGGENITFFGNTQAYKNMNQMSGTYGGTGCTLFTKAGASESAVSTVTISDEVLEANKYVNVIAKMDITLDAPLVGGTYTISPNQTKAVAKGTEITIYPVPEAKFRLAEITVSSNNGLKKQVLTGTKFTMPGYPVTITVTFEKIPCIHTPGPWLRDASGHYRSCSLCFTILDKKAPHSDSNGDGKCDICNYNLNAQQSTPSSTNTNNSTTTVKKKTPYVKLNVSSIPLQVKKSTSVVKITSKYPSNDKVESHKSSNIKVATVNNKGKVTAKKVGKATITVTMKSGAKAKYTVKVQKGKVVIKSLKLNKKSYTLKKGKTFTLTATKNPITATEKITYSSSNKKVATVSSKGKITAKKKGKATITVKTSNGKKATCKITVK